MKDSELKKGRTYKFDNEKYQLEIDGDDLRQAEVQFTLNGPRVYNIRFNSKLIHSTRFFSSMKKRLEKLKRDWHLIEKKK